jgi:ADP-ribose pyrophosphatase YjhB (NUDIX family)
VVGQLTPGEDPLAHAPRSDFLGVFAVIEDARGLLMVQNARTIAGREVRTWDLPGGAVEAGERLDEALARELREETGLALAPRPQFLFVQDGVRVRGGRRTHAWRSFFFRAEADGEPRAGGEVLAVRWFLRRELDAVLTAPYHDSFAQWLRSGGSYFTAEWREPG